MRSHWETSEKSIYVRTVWINGVRHAILSKNDPLLNGNSVPKRPYSCGNIDQSVRRNKKRLSTDYNRSMSTSSSKSTGIDTRTDGLESDNDYEYRFDADPISDRESEKTTRRNEHRTVKYKKIKLPNVNPKPVHNFSETQTQSYTNYLLKNNFINPITERVLNWLDLASKETNAFGEHLGGTSEQTDNGSNEKDEASCEENVANRRVSTDGVRCEVENVTDEQYQRIIERHRIPSSTSHRYQDIEKYQDTDGRYLDTDNSWMRQPHRNTSNASINQINKIQRNNEWKSDRQSKRFTNGVDEQPSRTPINIGTPTAPNGVASNITFNFQTITNATRVNEKSSPYSKNIRQNNDTIRRNNENITRLENNIDQFKKTNEIPHTSRKETDKHNSNRNTNRTLGNASTDENNNPVSRSKHKKGHRKSKSHGKKYTSNGEEPVKQAEEDCNYLSDEDINDTFRYVIMTRKENDPSLIPSLNRHNEHPSSMTRYQEYTLNRTVENTASKPSRYSSVLSEASNSMNRTVTTGYEVSRKYPKIDDVSRRFPNADSYSLGQQPLLYQPSRPLTSSSKPQLHIFMPRFQNIS